MAKRKPERKVHSWRPCPLGKHWVSAHIRHRTSGRGLAYVQNVRGHCRTNRSHLDHLYRADIQEVAAKNFSKLNGPPAKDNLVATESSFDPKKWNHRRGDAGAYGLMQVLNESVQLLKNPREFQDHFVNLDDGDMIDPNMAICAGIRWLFRKKQLAGPNASWRDAVAVYKGVSPNEKKLMPRFDKYYGQLKGKK